MKCWFLTFCWESLERAAAWSLEPVDITKGWVSSSAMDCQLCIAAIFPCCLFVGLLALSRVFSKWNACLIRWRSGDWLGHCKIFHFFVLTEALGLYQHRNDPATIHNCCLLCCPGHFHFQSSPVKWIYQTGDSAHPNIFVICLYFFLFFSPRMVSFTFISAHVMGPQQHLPNTNPTPGINSRPFTCLTDDGFVRNGQCTPWKRFQDGIPVTFGPLKKRLIYI